VGLLLTFVRPMNDVAAVALQNLFHNHSQRSLSGPEMRSPDFGKNGRDRQRENMCPGQMHLRISCWQPNKPRLVCKVIPQVQLIVSPGSSQYITVTYVSTTISCRNSLSNTQNT
jgi:hypothetical protein